MPTAVRGTYRPCDREVNFSLEEVKGPSFLSWTYPTHAGIWARKRYIRSISQCEATFFCNIGVSKALSLLPCAFALSHDIN